MPEFVLEGWWGGDTDAGKGLEEQAHLLSRPHLGQSPLASVEEPTGLCGRWSREDPGLQGAGFKSHS
jgi:hypothetical protein